MHQRRPLGLLLSGFALAGTALAVAPATAEAATGFSTQTRWAWVYQAIATTPGVDQTATARVTGLTNEDRNAAFQFRRSSSTTFLRVTFSGTRYQVAGVVDGRYTRYVDEPFRPGADGTAKVVVTGTTVRAWWNDRPIETHTVAALSGFTGHTIGVGVWQDRAASVNIIDAHGSTGAGISAASAASDPSAAGAATVTSGANPTAATGAPGHWLSGAAGEGVLDGSFGAWRGSPVQITAAWSDSYAEQTAQWAVQRGGTYGTWDKDLDLAIGGIYKDHGQSWAAAAAGAYDGRFRTAFENIKKGWGTRTGTLHIRFAHEFNGDWVPWSVTAGEVSDFVATWRRVHDIMKSVLPGAKFVFSPNDGSARSLGLDWRKAWPGKAYVDELSVDSYNMYPYVDTYQGFLAKINMTDWLGAPVGIERYRAFAASVGVPMALSEWGSNAAWGNGAAYMRLFHDWVAAHAGTGPGQVSYEILFNVRDSFGGVFELFPGTRQPAGAAAYASSF